MDRQPNTLNDRFIAVFDVPASGIHLDETPHSNLKRATDTIDASGATWDVSARCEFDIYDHPSVILGFVEAGVEIERRRRSQVTVLLADTISTLSEVLTPDAIEAASANGLEVEVEDEWGDRKYLIDQDGEIKVKYWLPNSDVEKSRDEYVPGTYSGEHPVSDEDAQLVRSLVSDALTALDS